MLGDIMKSKAQTLARRQARSRKHSDVLVFNKSARAKVIL